MKGYFKGDTLNRTKPPRFKVGDKVKLFWKQRTKYKVFAYNKRNNTDYSMSTTDMIKFVPQNSIIFNKHLGTVEITEVFKIELGFKEKYRTEEWKGYYCHYFDGRNEYGDEIWLRDGFNSAKQMFNYFDKNYDLNNPKEFWVYRWKWL